MAVTEFNVANVPSGREEIARMIVKAFATAGFGAPQQLAALANAIGESKLNPQAVSAAPDQSVGLFQLNRSGGLGSGHTVAELQDPMTNIGIVVKEAGKHGDFASAASLEDAVSVFVRKVARPSNATAEIARRTEIANGLLPKAGA